MAISPQTPGLLNVSFVRGDDWGQLLDLSIDTTGYTFTAAVYSLLTGANVASCTVNHVSPSTGQVNVSLPHTQTASLEAGTYGIKVSWSAPGDARRRCIDGMCEVLA